ncbi:hypothetical protein NQ176_g5581 [Zarea fungicola]|uniref:Uncharacterized protein n=1 Tax=Zarea fungicola TaxID=93591 RepID=A0ACC1N8R7_9HYPO|nr:hypothetical protein NQ176_g5581 [Lecanicillium fungicola]
MQGSRDENTAKTDGSKATANLVLEAGAAIFIAADHTEFGGSSREHDNENDDQHLSRANNRDDQRGAAAFCHTG